MVFVWIWDCWVLGKVNQERCLRLDPDSETSDALESANVEDGVPIQLRRIKSEKVPKKLDRWRRASVAGGAQLYILPLIVSSPNLRRSHQQDNVVSTSHRSKYVLLSDEDATILTTHFRRWNFIALVGAPRECDILLHTEATYPLMRSSLSELNDDCIRLIMDELRLIALRDFRQDITRSLERFSAIAHRYRQLALPILFSRCLVPLVHPEDRFIPENLWSYVRYGSLFLVQQPS